MPRPARSVPEINLSQIQEWLRCRYRWDLRYRRGIDRRQLHGPMDLGSAVHAGIAASIRTYGHTQKVTKALMRRVDTSLVNSVFEYGLSVKEKMGGWNSMHQDEQIQMQEIEEAGIEVARRAVAALNLPRWKTVWLKNKPIVERRLWLKSKGFRFHGTPDWVAVDTEDGSTWILDYKIRKSFTPVEAEELNVQFPAYQRLLRAHGVECLGSIMFQVKARQESQPVLNKNGSMSRAKIACTWDTYAAALVKAGLNPEDYITDMKPKLDTEFYRSTPMARTPEHVDAIWDNIVVPAALEMIKGDGHPTRHMHFMNCNGCWARDMCQAELLGDDIEFLLQTGYVDTNDPAPRIPLRITDFENLITQS